MLIEYIDRVIAELKKNTEWPRLDDVRAIMEKVAAEIEKDAIDNPIVPASVEVWPGIGEQSVEIVDSGTTNLTEPATPVNSGEVLPQDDSTLTHGQGDPALTQQEIDSLLQPTETDDGHGST